MDGESRHLDRDRIIRNRDAAKFTPCHDIYFVKPMKKPSLLEEARAIRSRAERMRRLAKATTDAEATKAILAYAEDLERRASSLEAKARALGELDEQALAPDEEVTRTLREEIERTRDTADRIDDSPASERDDGTDEGEPR